MLSARQPSRGLPFAVSWRLGMPASLCVAGALLLGCDEACAAALGSLATSAGLFAAFALLFVVKGWPAQVPAAALSTAGGMIVVCGGAAWWWRTRAPQRLAGIANAALALHAARGVALRTEPAARLPIALPAGLECAPLLAELRLQFVHLQAAWDAREMPALRRMTTPQMLDELCFEWPGSDAPFPSNRTDVVTLHAELLGFEDVAGTQLASVEFSGLIREGADQGAVPFRELWMLARAQHDEAGWKLARQQALL